MAGDWIKVEHATLDKPEVGYFAEMLGVKADEALGILLRFWVWLDRNARNGCVTHVTQQSLDTTMHCPGFSSSIVTVGWAEMDSATNTLRVPNFERHNETPAKTRSSNAERQAKYRAKQRNESNVTRNVTSVTEPLPEKRREEVTTQREKRAPIVAPTDEHLSLAASLGIDCAAEWLKYRDQQQNAARKHSDLEAGFRNWLRRAHEFRPAVRAGGGFNAKQDARAKAAAQIFGATNERNDEHVIDGEAQRVA